MYKNTNEIIRKSQLDKKEMGELIEKNSGLIWSIVKRFVGRGYEKEELYQIGAIGFIKAIKRFDTSYNVQLSTFAVPYILGEIKRFLRDDGIIKVSRNLKELSMKINDLQRRNIIEKGEEITIAELAKKLKVTKEEIAAAIDSSKPINSIDEEVYENENGITKIEQIKTEKNETDELINNMCIKKLIQDLEEREKQLIILRYYKGKTQTEVAKILGITQVQVSRIEKKVLINMREKMKETA